MKGHPIPYSADELAFLSENRAMPRRELHAAFVERFNRPDLSLDALKQALFRRGWSSGRNGRFLPGAAPANKGKKMPFNENSARTQFKKGQVPPNTKWLGHERVDSDGYVQISIAATNPHTGFHRRYVLKHLWLWEQQNGKLPPGMCLKCLGDKTNTDPSNWEAIPRAMLPRLNGRFGRGYDAAPAEIKPTILAIATLEHAVRAKQRPAKPPRKVGQPSVNAKKGEAV